MSHCPSCLEDSVPPSGRSKELLLVIDAPHKEDLYRGSLFSTHQKYVTPGKILRRELERLGVSIMDFRWSSLWLHAPTNNENCYQAGYDTVLNEAKGKKAILLMGADTVSAFTEYKVSDVSGLQVDSAVLSAPIIFAMSNPSLALAKGVGEVRLGIEKFVRRLQEEGLLQ